MGVFAVDFRRRARNWWGLLVSNRASFEGRRDGGEGQGAGVVQVGVDEGGNVGKGREGRHVFRVGPVPKDAAKRGSQLCGSVSNLGPITKMTILIAKSSAHMYA